MVQGYCQEAVIRQYGAWEERLTEGSGQDTYTGRENRFLFAGLPYYAGSISSGPLTGPGRILQARINPAIMKQFKRKCLLLS